MRLSLRLFPVFLSCSLLICPVFQAVAGNKGHISGYVKSASGIPIGDAFIKIFQEAREGRVLSVAGIRSDSQGMFRAANLAPGTYYVQVSRPGYQPSTTQRFRIESERTTSLNIILDNFIDLLSNDEDPRNWNLQTVMRSSSDRRLIFRNVPGTVPGDGETRRDPFYRSGTMSLASNTLLSSDSYQVRPQANQNGVTTNFAFTEPLSPHSRMILSGQLDFGFQSFWRVRNTFNYRPDRDQDYRISVGYGRMTVNYPGSGSLSPRLLSEEEGSHESSIQTLDFSAGGQIKLLDLVAIKYGLDYSRLRYRQDRSFIYPALEIIVTPALGWCFKTSVSSRRLSDVNTVLLPDGESVSFSEPTLITMVGDKVSMSQIRHSEVSVRKTVMPDTSIEIAVYQDTAQGPGPPLMVTAITPTDSLSKVVEMNEDRSRRRGTRVTIDRRFLDSISGSIAYVYGTATNIAGVDESIWSDHLGETLLRNARQRYHHSITGQVDAVVPVTKTNLLATVRWYHGNPLTPIDWFSDRMDIGSKSINFEIRQALPMLELLGATGRWEILVDLRNLLNQGKEIVAANDGELVLNRNPRSLRFGLTLSFH